MNAEQFNEAIETTFYRASLRILWTESDAHLAVNRALEYGYSAEDAQRMLKRALEDIARAKERLETERIHYAYDVANGMYGSPYTAEMLSHWQRRIRSSISVLDGVKGIDWSYS